MDHIWREVCNSRGVITVLVLHLVKVSITNVMQGLTLSFFSQLSFGQVNNN